LGGLSKIVASVATYPYQVIKSKLQQRESELEHKRYRGMIDCVVKIWKSQGFIGFFRGLMPNILKVVPSSALTFLVYEETMKILRSSMTPQP
jgi:solute carrier family 25 folate transporter 32